MAYVWDQLRGAIPLITHGNPYIMNLLWVSIRVALISTSAALVIGLPIGLALGLGRFRGRRALQILANASLALPPVVVGIGLLLLLLPQGAFGSLQIEFSLQAVYVAQAILALPYIVALTPAAIQGLPPGLLAQARALGAGRIQLSLLALREAKIGLLAAVIAAVGATLSEVGAVVLVGGNFQGHDETLASALMEQFNYTGHDPVATAIAIVLLALILVLAAVLTLIQQRTDGIQLRFRTG
ncbi:MAG: ABC transporter permease [Solirubrobacterales bacterium]|nr:ABC transporter permease [Solirubrobacterales bacterium]MBV9716434.1 ABC transporter permease [Solirubrobacterales bacterium]